MRDIQNRFVEVEATLDGGVGLRGLRQLLIFVFFAFTRHLAVSKSGGVDKIRYRPGRTLPYRARTESVRQKLHDLVAFFS